MPTLMFYEKPIALNRKLHQKLRLKKATNLDFSKNVNSVPLAGIEFFEASRELPILFTKGSDGLYIPLALLSLRYQGHQLGDSWGEVYMPAFIRRYPFALANDGTVIIDEAAPHLQEEEGDLLFREEGENSELLDKIIAFLHGVDRDYKRTQEYSNACAERELFVPFKAQVMVDKDKAMKMDSLFVIDDQKLAKLSDSEAVDWYHKGWLAWSYAHLHSLGALGRLARREHQLAGEETTEEAQA